MQQPDFPIYMAPGTYDAVVNGKLVTNLEPRLVFINSADDLEALTGYAPGAFAVTYDLASTWVCSPDGSWVPTDTQATE